MATSEPTASKSDSKSEKRGKHKRKEDSREYIIRPRDRKQRKHYTDDWAFGDEEIDGGQHAFDLEERLNSPRFGQHSSLIKEMQGQEVTVAFFQRHGFNFPILVKEKAGLGINVPSDKFTINDVRMCVGSRRVLDVMDVRTQKNMEMTMKEWQKYYEDTNKDRLLNVISLEFSHTKLENYVHTPTVVRQIDWVDCVWPRHLKEAQTESTNVLEDMMYPKVQKYCLMSVKGCYTDFHIDFGGTSVWYHILKGAKVFWLIPPTERNISLYEQWVLSGKQSDVFFGDLVDKCCRVHLMAGNTFFIPSGWIHAVFTPKDSLVFGGNFLHSFGVEKQLRIAQCEDNTKVPQKFRYPFFTEMLWYVLERYVHCLLGNTHLQLPPEEEALRNSLRPTSQVHLTMQELHGLKSIVLYLHELPPYKKNVPELIQNPIRLITDVRDLVHAHCQDNPMLAINGRPVLRPLTAGLHGDRRQPLSRSTGNRGGGGSGRGRGGGGGRGRGGHRIPAAAGAPPASTAPPAPPAGTAPPPAPVVGVTPPSSERGGSSKGDSGGPRRRRTRCKKCEACMRSDCGECPFCLDMVKFGGPGRAKQTCVMRQCLQPMLPVTAACVACRLDGWGKEPVVPIQKSAERTTAPSTLMECSVCYEIIHPACATAHLPPGSQHFEGQVNEDMPNSWECPRCCNEGKNVEYKPRHFRARNKTSAGGTGAGGSRRNSVSSEGSLHEELRHTIKTERPDEIEEGDPHSLLPLIKKEPKSEPPRLSPVKLEPPHLSPEVKRRRQSIDSDGGDIDPGPPLLEEGVARPISGSLGVSSASFPGRSPPLRSQLAAQLCGNSSKPLKRPFVVVRPSVSVQQDSVDKHAPRPPGTNLALDRAVLMSVFRWLTQTELNHVMLVCQTWASVATQPVFWRHLSMYGGKIAGQHLQGIFRRQPVKLTLDWSNISFKQLGWLLPRLPQLHTLSLQGCSWWTCVHALKSCCCPTLTSLDLGFVSLINDSNLHEMLSPPPDSRPGLMDPPRSRLRCLKEIHLTGCEISDVALRYIVQYLKQLESLCVAQCVKVTNAGIAMLAQRTSSTVSLLHTLDVSGCVLITTTCLQYLPHLTALRTFNCTKVPIDRNAMIDFLSKHPKVTIISEKLN